IFYFVSNYFPSPIGHYNLFEFDPVNNKFIPHLPFDPDTDYLNWTLNRYSSTGSEDTFLIYSLNDTIYNIKDRKIIAQYRVNFSKRGKTDAAVRKEREYMEQTNGRSTKSFIYGLEYLQQFGNKVLATYVDNYYFRYLLFDKTSMEFNVFEDITIGTLGGFTLFNYSISDNLLISFRETSTVKNTWTNVFRKNATDEQWAKKIDDIIDSAQQDDNLVIFLCKIKEE
ncbi:MAG: 6-bladed beta-propeller, partial [Bacteroides sp.]|nr:6-bladed beta-propeller [Bacteroides sp.]